MRETNDNKRPVRDNEDYFANSGCAEIATFVLVIFAAIAVYGAIKLFT